MKSENVTKRVKTCRTRTFSPTDSADASPSDITELPSRAARRNSVSSVATSQNDYHVAVNGLAHVEDEKLNAQILSTIAKNSAQQGRQPENLHDDPSAIFRDVDVIYQA